MLYKFSTGWDWVQCSFVSSAVIHCVTGAEVGILNYVKKNGVYDFVSSLKNPHKPWCSFSQISDVIKYSVYVYCSSACIYIHKNKTSTETQVNNDLNYKLSEQYWIEAKRNNFVQENTEMHLHWEILFQCEDAVKSQAGHASSSFLIGCGYFTLE